MQYYWDMRGKGESKLGDVVISQVSPLSQVDVG